MKKKLYLIDNDNQRDPRLNLALEEYALRNVDIDHDYVFLYINQPSVIIGRHQNAFGEVNLEYAKEHGIQVIRRISGGGAVYHDQGNLNFSFITHFEKSKFNNYKKFTEPVIKVLRSLGVEAVLDGRNGIVVDGRKISGNAQFTRKERMFSHGTLLFDSNLNNLIQALDVRSGRFESRAIKSTRSRVANISQFLSSKMKIDQFKQLLIHGIFGNSQNVPILKFPKSRWRKIWELADRKYGSWEWNFGESPEFHFKNSRQFSFGEIDVTMVIKKGMIRALKFSADFPIRRDISELEKFLTDIRYEKEALTVALKTAHLSRYFGEITDKAFLDLLY